MYGMDGKYGELLARFDPDARFTDLAITLPPPHRHLDVLAVAGAVAVLTRNVPIATGVVDPVRRHPSLLAQTALTLDHLARGRFILGVGSATAIAQPLVAENLFFRTLQGRETTLPAGG